MFEDVPLDTRHHVVREKPRFPKEWRIDAQRQAALDNARREATLLEAAKIESGQLLDGDTIVRNALEAKELHTDTVNLLVAAGKQSGQATKAKGRR